MWYNTTGTTATTDLYTDSLQNDWENWSWGTTLTYNNTTPVYTGTHSLKAQYSGAWTGIYLHSDTGVNSSTYDTLTFYIHGGTTGGQELYPVLYDSNDDYIGSVNLSTYVPTITANTWYTVSIPLTDFGVTTHTIGAFSLESANATTIYIDDLQFTGGSTQNGTTYTWDYNNRLAHSDDGTTALSYTYDTNGQRLTKDDGTTATVYPNTLYNTDGTTITKHLYAGGDLIATVADTTTTYIHTDHLGGTAVTTNTNGEVTELADYYPFGQQRVSELYEGSTEQRKFTGHEYDGETDLTYAGARYYDQGVGRWLSQDPVFLNLGVDSRTMQVLTDPQLHNSYTYARNNPIIATDPNGEFFFVPALFYAASVGLTAWSAYDIANNTMDAYNTGGLVAAGGTLATGVAIEATLGKVGKVVDGAKFISKATTEFGGSYKSLKGLVPGNDVHHMPADSVSPLKKGDGPAISMGRADHKKTASYGNSKEAQSYRAQQQSMVDQGDFRGAQQMDIDDLHSKFGTKYDNAVPGAQNYTDTLNID